MSGVEDSVENAEYGVMAVGGFFGIGNEVFHTANVI